MKMCLFSSSGVTPFILFMLCGVALSAQNYYQVGVDYVYRSLKNDDDTKVSILTVQFNASGVASITRTEETSLSSDEPAVYALAPMLEIVVSSSTGDPTELEITTDGNQYWLIPMDDPGMPQQLTTAGHVEIHCDCKRGSGNCSVSTIVQNDSANSTCVPEAGCFKCKIRVVNKGKNIITDGGALLIKAQSVVMN